MTKSSTSNSSDSCSIPRRLLESSSRISTKRRCDNCGFSIDGVVWKQCVMCHVFDLCTKCSKLSYAELQPSTRGRHEKYHRAMSVDELITHDCLASVSVKEGEKHGNAARKKFREKKFYQMLKDKKIQNDYEMSIVMEKLKQLEFLSSEASKEAELLELNSLIARYHLEGLQRNIRVLSLDGGGVRGYMPIKVLTELITQKYMSAVESMDFTDPAHKEIFRAAQLEFTEKFDYFVGTSTGALIAFCLATNHNIMNLKGLYEQASYYFKRNHLGPLIYSKYDPCRIHRKIDEIINLLRLPDGKSLSAEHATLLDIRNILNPDNIIDDHQSELFGDYHGDFLEFVDEKDFVEDFESIDEDETLHRIKSEKVLLITAYSISTNTMIVFNTSYSKHWKYRIADVLKATMAAPTYFPPHAISSGKKVNGHFVKDSNLSELYIDGGAFANDPELTALWAIRMQWKKLVNYDFLSVGTGCYSTELPSVSLGGYFDWIFSNGYLVNTLMDATRSFIETIANNLAQFSNMKRMKLNYSMTQSLDLDDASFVKKFDEEWERLKNEDDFKAFIYFYEKCIAKQHS